VFSTLGELKILSKGDTHRKSQTEKKNSKKFSLILYHKLNSCLEAFIFTVSWCEIIFNKQIPRHGISIIPEIQGPLLGLDRAILKKLPANGRVVRG
jgi:hypothetical protein